MKNLNDKLSQALEIEPLELSPPTVIEPTTEVVVSDDPVDNDAEYARQNLKNLIAKGNDAVDHIVSIAKQSEHPRAIEVVGNLMKQLADINQQLLDLHQQKQKLDGPKVAEKNVTNNSIFVGSTQDLAKMIQNMKKGE